MWTIQYGSKTLECEGNAYAAIRAAARYFALREFASISPDSLEGSVWMSMRISQGDFARNVNVSVPYAVNIEITGEPTIERPEDLAGTVGME